jgi:hydrogenase maturation protease
MLETLIIGCGSPLRGDDGFGWHAAARLSAAVDGKNVSVIACHQLTPELAEAISRTDLVIFVDAAAVGTPGELRIRRVASSTGSPTAFSHHVTPSGLLGWTREWFGRSPEAVMFSVCGENFDFSQTLSAIVEAAMARLIQRVLRLLERRTRRAAKPAAILEGR